MANWWAVAHGEPSNVGHADVKRVRPFVAMAADVKLTLSHAASGRPDRLLGLSDPRSVGSYDIWQKSAG
jgi:hypothetical protein